MSPHAKTADDWSQRVTGSIRSILWRASTSTRALSIAGVAIWAPLGLVRSTARQAPAGFTTEIGKFVLGLVALLIVAIAASWFVRKTILRGQPRYRSSVLRTFFAYLTTLVVVGVAQLLLSVGGGFGPTPSLARLLPSLFLLYVVGCLLDYFDHFRSNLQALGDERAKLTFLREQNAELLFGMRNHIVDRLQHKVQPAGQELTTELVLLRDAQNTSSNQLSSVAEEIRAKLIRVVREFSYEIENLQYSWSPSITTPPRVYAVSSATNWRKVLTALPTARPFRPLLVALTLIVSAVGNIEHVNLVVAFFSTTAAGLLAAFVLLLARFLLAPTLRETNSVLGWLVCIGVYAIAASVAAIPLYWAVALTGYPHPGGTAVTSVMVMLLCLVWGLLGSAQQNATETAASLQQIVDLTRREAAALEQERDMELTRIAHELHGEVQSMFTAAAFRLDTTAELLEDHPGSCSTRLTDAIDQTLLMITGAFDQIALIGGAGNSIRTSDVVEPNIVEALSALATSWRGIVDITLTIDEPTTHRLNARSNDASLTPTVVDIVREAILNATRHALAANVWIKIVGDETTCLITVENDGDVPDNDVQSGLGQQLLERLQCTWSLTPRQPDGAVLTVSLPLLQRTDTPSQ